MPLALLSWMLSARRQNRRPGLAEDGMIIDKALAGK
jgi:hypothetical protein